METKPIVDPDWWYKAMKAYSQAYYEHKPQPYKLFVSEKTKADIMEVAAYERALTTKEVEQVNNYFENHLITYAPSPVEEDQALWEVI